MLKRLLSAGIIFFFASSCFAANAGNTSDTKIPYGPGIANMQTTGLGPFKVGFDCDWIFDKDLEGASGVTSAETEGQWYLLRIGYTFAERIEPYVRLGISHLKASWKETGNDMKVKGENAFAYGVGGKVLVYEIPEHNLRVSLDGQYRYTDPDIEEAFMNNPNRVVSAAEFKISEWQISGIISIEFPLDYNKRDPAAIYSIIPYAGFAYFDSDTKAKFTHLGAEYNLGSAENEDKLLFITGCDVVSPDNISFNLEGRWVGEAAASGGFTVKF